MALVCEEGRGVGRASFFITIPAPPFSVPAAAEPSAWVMDREFKLWSQPFRDGSGNLPPKGRMRPKMGDGPPTIFSGKGDAPPGVVVVVVG